MKLDALGHSAFLLEMENAAGDPVRILGDPWLSDHVIGDLMGRYPRVRLDYAQTPRIHGIYLSHSHTDHFDPYSLLALWEGLAERPAFLLPQSIEYLAPLLAEHLPGADFAILNEAEPIGFHGLDVSGLFNPETLGTNEDDVMMLLVENEKELFLAEADAVFPYHDPAARGMISSLLDREGLETVGILAIKNELQALMASVHAQSTDERRELVAGSLLETVQEIESTFYDFDAGPDLWRDPRLVRFVGGQGICFPVELETDWNHVLFPIPLEERVRLEREISRGESATCRIEAFQPGTSYRCEQGRVESDSCEYFKTLNGPESIAYRPDVPLFEHFPEAPLCSRSVGVSSMEPRILGLLNERFLPWFVGRRQPPVEHLLSAYGGEYRIRVQFGSEPRVEDVDYCLTFEELRFRSNPAEGEAEETYWAADLEDYLDGKCDDFSTFCRRRPQGDARHLWDCLGMPYLNNDLVEKKLRFHFERAKRGESLSDWALGFYEPAAAFQAD